jgi:hypothetical protein
MDPTLILNALIKSRTLKLTPAPGIFPGISKVKYSSSSALVIGDKLIIIRVVRSRVSTRATQCTVWHTNAMLQSEIGQTPGIISYLNLPWVPNTRGRRK